MEIKARCSSMEIKPRCNSTEIKPRCNSTEIKPRCNSTEIKPRCNSTEIKPRCNSMQIKPCSAKRRKVRKQDGIDRISGLQDDLLAIILSLVSTKEAVATSVLSRRWRRVYTWVTSLDFDSNLCHCMYAILAPYRGRAWFRRNGPDIVKAEKELFLSQNQDVMESFAAYKSFVDNVLRTCQSENVTSFSLSVCKPKGTAIDYITHSCSLCREGCFPNVEPMRLNTWLLFPLSRGVRILDIFVHVSEPGNLPSAIFSCRTLEVLKIDVNLQVEGGTPMSSYCLPNLKVCRLSLFRIPNGEFLTRFVASCPALEELAVEGRMEVVHSFNVCSSSLRRLNISMVFDDTSERSGCVILDTPNLEYLKYADTISVQYRIGNLNSLVEASIEIFSYPDVEICHSFSSLVRPLSNVRCLSLLFTCMEILQYLQGKHKLPVFQNLKSLHLGYCSYQQWNVVLLELLNCSPFLELLTFPEGISADFGGDEIDTLVAELEIQYWSTLQEVPPCLGSQLKTISIQTYMGTEAELKLVTYFLRNALVLEELVIAFSTHLSSADIISLANTLHSLPRGSVSCSIAVRED